MFIDNTREIVAKARELELEIAPVFAISRRVIAESEKNPLQTIMVNIAPKNLTPFYAQFDFIEIEHGVEIYRFISIVF